ncbi:hypothetical protein A0J48_024750 [Sphaerospermopsis aphanizomenoides BCCUSP55]|uniref:hypothetical protein n=1 Tax=Sphaerospermopsis aphanizomenoides TaxID=459663 RepID=UPI000A874395|nr:hypothetical protein [Sphaerospermopsis aphanizomenoides]MBK1990685.1 hypothetical protein [Sphaerospermopsis aphanizomenoides BCCUSP55]
MSNKKKEPSGCGCANIPLSVIIAILGGGYWLFTQRANIDIGKLVSQVQQFSSPILNSTPIASPIPTPSLSSTANITPNQKQSITTTITPPATPLLPTPAKIPPQTTSLPANPWQKKVIRGIYLSRYQITNNADEKNSSKS